MTFLLDTYGGTKKTSADTYKLYGGGTSAADLMKQYQQIAQAVGGGYTGSPAGGSTIKTKTPVTTQQTTQPTVQIVIQSGGKKKKKEETAEQPQEQQPQQQQPQQFNLPEINIPYPPFPVPTEVQRQEWLQRALQQAALQYDPYIQQIAQNLAKAELEAERTKEWTSAAYAPVIESIAEWAKKEKEFRQQDLARRRLWESGILTGALQDVAEKELKQRTTVETERARALSDIARELEGYRTQAKEKAELAQRQKGVFAGEYAKQLEDEWTTLMTNYQMGKFDAEFRQAATNIQNMLAERNMQLMLDEFEWKKITDKEQLALQKTAQRLAEIQANREWELRKQQLELQRQELQRQTGAGDILSDIENIKKLADAFGVKIDTGEPITQPSYGYNPLAGGVGALLWK